MGAPRVDAPSWIPRGPARARVAGRSAGASSWGADARLVRAGDAARGGLPVLSAARHGQRGSHGATAEAGHPLRGGGGLHGVLAHARAPEDARPAERIGGGALPRHRDGAGGRGVGGDGGAASRGSGRHELREAPRLGGRAAGAALHHERAPLPAADGGRALPSTAPGGAPQLLALRLRAHRAARAGARRDARLDGPRRARAARAAWAHARAGRGAAGPLDGALAPAALPPGAARDDPPDLGRAAAGLRHVALASRRQTGAARLGALRGRGRRSCARPCRRA